MRVLRHQRESAIVIRARHLVLGLLLVGALVLRFRDIETPLLTYHAIRQYRSAIIARSCYYESAPKTPEWARQVAIANRTMQPAAEPPMLEWAACAGYRLLGRELLALPRALSAAFWLVGVLPLYRIAQRLASPDAALIAVALYLYLPYTFPASVSFQPDPLMTMAALWATLALVRHREHPTRGRLLLAAGAVAATALIKPMSVFFTLPALASLAWVRLGTGMVSSLQFWGLSFLSLVPAAAYYGYGALFGSLARDQMTMRFVPDLLDSAFFWGGWLSQVQRVFTLPVLALALIGTAVAPAGTPRALLVGLWTGYVAFAVAFTYHMPTHDYYHLPFISVAALGVAALAARVQRGLFPARDPRVSFWSAVAMTGLIVAMGVSAGRRGPGRADAVATVDRYEQIGKLVGHETKTLFLDQEYGYPLMYHGQLSGDAWPNADDLVASALGGAEPMSAGERFERDYANFRPAYFVITDLASFEAQPDLKQFLGERASLVETNEHFSVYRLR